MMISENTKAILLITTFFNSKEVKQYKPLTENGYGYFACWLNQNGFKPEDLLTPDDFDKIFLRWEGELTHKKPKETVDFAKLNQTISGITYKRMKALVSRGASLSLALDKWFSVGIWIMDRQHPNYPKAIKISLKHKSPALLFGIGNKELLNQPAIGFVGSRNCSAEDTKATQGYVKVINQLGYQVVSGAAKGIDTEAMLSSLNNGHAAVGIVADSLFRASGSGQWRQALRNNQLALITPFYPEAGFTPRNAMARNKYIYMLSVSTVVVCSGEKGGTWEGAKKDLKNGWAPLLVSTHTKPLQAGNQALLSGIGVTKPIISAQSVMVDGIADILNGSDDSIKLEEKSLNTSVQVQSSDEISSRVLIDNTKHQRDLFSNNDKCLSQDKNVQKGEKSVSEPLHSVIVQTVDDHSESGATPEPMAIDPIENMPLLTQFYEQLAALLKAKNNKLISEDRIKEHFPEFDIMGKTALTKWLKQLNELGLLVRPNARKKEYSLCDVDNK